MSKPTDGRTAQTGAIFGRGIFAVRRHTYKPNTIRKAKRYIVITSIDTPTLAEIDTIAAKYGETRGEAITRIVRDCQREIRALKWRCGIVESELAKVR